jgi:hypothetical protein
VRVTFNELAERELNDAAQYYELERPGLGAGFIDEVQRCSEAIAAPPMRDLSSAATFASGCVIAAPTLCCTS